MATTHFLSANVSQGSISTIPQPNTSDHSLFTRINEIFVLYVGYLTVCVPYCLYNLYQAYQWIRYPSFSLDDALKFVKCRALIQEAQTSENAQPLLEQCEALLNSMTSSDDKDKLLMLLFRSYLEKEDTDRSFQIAPRLSSFCNIFEAIKRLYEVGVDVTKLKKRLVEAFKNLENDQSDNVLKRVEEMIGYAKDFHSLNHSELVDECMGKALGLANDYLTGSARFKALCQVTQCFQEMENRQKVEEVIETVQALLTESSSSGSDTVEDHLELAHTFFRIDAFNEMDQQLEIVVQQIEVIKGEDPIRASKALYSLAHLVSKLKKNEKAVSDFKGFEAKSLIQSVLKMFDGEKRGSNVIVKTVFILARIYQEKLVDDESQKQTSLEGLFAAISGLPESNSQEIADKGESLLCLADFYIGNSEKILNLIGELESFYDRYPPLSSSPFFMSRASFGKGILKVYKKVGLKDLSSDFFQKYLSDLSISQAGIPDQILQLVKGAKFCIEFDRWGKNQRINDRLQQAEALLPQVGDAGAYNLLLLKIAQAYLQIDQKKCLQLLKDYEDGKARSYLITAFAIPILMGIGHYYSRVAHILAFGVTAVGLYRGL